MSVEHLKPLPAEGIPTYGPLLSTPPEDVPSLSAGTLRVALDVVAALSVLMSAVALALAS
ncbi:MAG: hypothetical protein EP299_13905 [Acidobacteria bacterium]|nr:MAG: hypothetical protein EP299_13905 [Acidobacteriota bacterium]